MTAALLITSGLMLMVLAGLSIRSAATVERAARTPLQQAERILAARYARGQLTAQEYQRTLAVLRR